MKKSIIKSVILVLFLTSCGLTGDKLSNDATTKLIYMDGTTKVIRIADNISENFVGRLCYLAVSEKNNVISTSISCP